MSLKEEIERRRTFAIISHPDAGKTTLTEKLLLFGGAIREAGAVKSNKIKKTATSDFMEIERQRGISVATSVMGFEYNGVKINILDTPGHQDFAEDTYRTLTAVDSVIVVIDVAKGVETQTEKLVSVCRMRDIPMMFFINKLDREGKDQFELLDDIEQKLGVKLCPMSWPVGMGKQFLGVYDIYKHRILFFNDDNKQVVNESVEVHDLQGAEAVSYLGDKAALVHEEVEMVTNIYPAFDRTQYLDSKICPVFFGSALNNFGVRDLLECFIDIAPFPKGVHTAEREVSAFEEKFTGFVFKIHANMDPNHRDRIAFVKVCSGVFRRNTAYLHVRHNKRLKFSNPTSFMAARQSIIDEAFPGDIVGIHDTGNFMIGDTLTEGELLHVKGIPSFAPELFRYIENADPMKSKQLAKGVEQLMDEGVAQLFTHLNNGRKIIGTVGSLQFDVIEFRLKNEYGASLRYEPLQLHKAVWVDGSEEDKADLKLRKYAYVAHDKHGRLVFLAESSYALQTTAEKYPKLAFHLTSEF